MKHRLPALMRPRGTRLRGWKERGRAAICVTVERPVGGMVLIVVVDLEGEVGFFDGGDDDSGFRTRSAHDLKTGLLLLLLLLLFDIDEVDDEASCTE